MSEINHQAAEQITAVTTDSPATSAKESNENDLHMKSDPLAFQSEQSTQKPGTVASEKLRYENADLIYPNEK